MIKHILFLFALGASAAAHGERALVARPVAGAGASPYEVLGLPGTANHTDIKRAYLSLTRKFRADKNGDKDAYARVQAAYAKISTARRRAIYDYGQRNGPRPADYALESPVSRLANRAVFDQLPEYAATLEKTRAADPSLDAAVKSWYNLPFGLRTEFPRWLGVARRGAYAAEMLIPAVFLAMASTPSQVALWGGTLGLFTALPPLTVIKNYLRERPRPRALVREYIESLESGTGLVAASLVAFDLVEPLVPGTQTGFMRPYAREYAQLRLDRMARTVPALALGQLLRYVQRDIKGIPNPWHEVFRSELRSRPKYWRARLAEVLPALKLSREGLEIYDDVAALDEELASVGSSTAIFERAGLHARRACEAALQIVPALLNR